MNKKLIIGLTGKAGSGKDTFASYLNNLMNVEIFAFADVLKQACKLIFNLTDEQLYKSKEQIDERIGKSPREIFQMLGTDLKKINNDVFIMNMENKIENSNAYVIIISDVRFNEEAKFIKSIGGKIIKIDRDTNLLNETTSKHISEKGISTEYIDLVIDNNYSLDEFYNRIEEIFLLLSGTV